MSTEQRQKGGRVDAREFLEMLLGETLTFGALLRAIREAEDMTLADFAEPLGISRQNLCDIEHGRRFVSPGRAAEWARALGYSEAQFVRLTLQDQVSQAGLQLRVSVDAA